MADAHRNPKCFLSYAWTDQAHVDRVLELAKRLTHDGIEIVIDKWDLKPGHDANTFMERSVADPTVTHTLILSNRIYVEKANARTGGAGTEAQIISPAIYSSTQQEKFILVALEVDENGEPYAPTFYKGRIHINLADAVGYESEYDTLIRALWGKPLHSRPPLGAMPAHLAEGATSRPVFAHSSYLRAIDALTTGKLNALSLLRAFQEQVAKELLDHKLVCNGENDFDDQVVESVEKLKPLVDQCQSLLTEIARGQPTDDILDVYFAILESVQQRTKRTSDVSTWYEVQFDNFRFVATELMLISAGVLLREQRFDLFTKLVSRRFLSLNPVPGAQGYTSDFSSFSHIVESLGHRNTRLQLNRASVFGDMLFSRRDASPLTAADLAQADLMLFLRDAKEAIGESGSYPTWWPVALMRYEDRYAPTPLFARAESKAFAIRIAAAIGVSNVSNLKDVISKVVQEKWLRGQRLGFGPDAKLLTNFDRLALYP